MVNVRLSDVAVEVRQGDVRLDERYDLRTLKRALKAVEGARAAIELGVAMSEADWLGVIEDDAALTRLGDQLQVSGR